MFADELRKIQEDHMLEVRNNSKIQVDAVFGGIKECLTTFVKTNSKPLKEVAYNYVDQDADLNMRFRAKFGSYSHEITINPDYLNDLIMYLEKEAGLICTYSARNYLKIKW